jgi:hypothetical protein
MRALPDNAAAGWAAMLLQHHEECTAEGHTGDDYPGKTDDLREYDRLITLLYRELGRDVPVAINRAEALYLARTLIPQPEETWRIELVDVDPDSPTCGQWITNPDITGPDARNKRSAVNEAMLLAKVGGHITRAVIVTTTPLWTSQLLPWKKRGR